MGCETIAEGLVALAEAIAAAGGGTGSGTGCTVYCGGDGTGALSGALAGIPDDQYLPAEATTPPEEGVPPEGFDTWQAYLTWKCQAAHAVWMELDRFMVVLESFDGLIATASLCAPTIALFAGASFAAITVSGLVLIVAAVLAMAAVWLSNMLIINQMRQYWVTNKDAIICELYTSGDAAAALTAIGDRIEDGIQAIEWGAVLGPVSVPLAEALGTALGAVQTNSLVNPLFKLVTGVALINVECPCYGQDTLMYTAPSEPYDVMLWGDSFTASVHNAAQGFQVTVNNWPHFYFTPLVNISAAGLSFDFWFNHDNWAVLESRIRRVSDGATMCQFNMPVSDDGWKSVAVNANVYLTVGVAYYLELTCVAQNLPWARLLSLGPTL